MLLLSFFQSWVQVLDFGFSVFDGKTSHFFIFKILPQSTLIFWNKKFHQKAKLNIFCFHIGEYWWKKICFFWNLDQNWWKFLFSSYSKTLLVWQLGLGFDCLGLVWWKVSFGYQSKKLLGFVFVRFSPENRYFTKK